MGDDDCFIIDFFNPQIFPNDKEALKGIKRLVHVSQNDNDESYLKKMGEVIPSSMDVFKPELVIYNAGTDCMKGDPLG